MIAKWMLFTGLFMFVVGAIVWLTGSTSDPYNDTKVAAAAVRAVRGVYIAGGGFLVVLFGWHALAVRQR